MKISVKKSSEVGNKTMMDDAARLWAFFAGGYDFLGCSSGIAFHG